MKRFTIQISTDGNTDVVNLQPELAQHIRQTTGDGLVHLFAAGSTCALTTIEFEPGLIKHDLKALMQKLIPDDVHYHHEATWNDDNGHSHLRATMLGPSMMVPFSNGKLLTGEYQQVVLVDFDTRSRRRTIVGTILS
jgi:secondary thiamine-phosphate synthase enzyme